MINIAGLDLDLSKDIFIGKYYNKRGNGVLLYKSSRYIRPVIIFEKDKFKCETHGIFYIVNYKSFRKSDYNIIDYYLAKKTCEKYRFDLEKLEEK